jgi:hypothetical protein
VRANWLPCVVTEMPLRFPDPSRLSQGVYEIVFAVREGPGLSTTGTLTLMPTSPNDRSPRSGKAPVDSGSFYLHPFYGAIEFDHVRIGVVFCKGKSPPPTSTDPTSPGVLVSVGWVPGYSRGTRNVFLVVGTVRNIRDGRSRIDGCGVGLVVHEITDRGFSGVWMPWGVRGISRGHFCARRTRDLPPPRQAVVK